MFQDGDTEVIDGTTYVRQGGAWHPQSRAVYGSPRLPSPQTPAQAEHDTLGVEKLRTDIAAAPIEREAKQVDIAVRQKQLHEPSEAQVKLVGRAAGLQLLEHQINNLETLYNRNFKGGGLGAAVEYLPGQIRPENAEFDNAGRALMGAIAQAQGLTAQQQNTPTELEIRFGPYIPKPSDRDEVIQFKIQQLKDLLNAQRNEIGAQQGAMGGQPAPSDKMAPATGATKEVVNAELTPVRREYMARLQAGQSGSQLVAFLRQAGVSDVALLKRAGEQAAFRRKNPNVPIERYDTSAIDHITQKMGAVNKTANTIGQSDFGAGAAAAGNAVTAGFMPDIIAAGGGNEEQARLAYGQQQQNHPTASLIGTLAGGTTAALGGEAALGAGGMAPGFGRALLADTSYGTAAGTGSSPDNRLAGAGQGALYGAAGSMAGQGIARGAANALSPSGGKLNQLYETGVRPTPGQRFVETGVAGRALNAAEEGLSSVPVVGSAIRGARQEARDQFQVGAFNESLKDIGLKLPKGMKPGTAPHQFAQRAFDNAYNRARTGLSVRGDQEMADEVATLGEQIGTLAEPSANRFYTILQNVVLRRVKGGAELSGEAYKDVQKDIGRIVRGIRKSKSGDDELADSLEDLQHILDGAARRHSPPEAVKALDDADRGYAKFVRIMDAAKAMGGDAGTFTPTQFNRSVQKNARGRRSEEYLRGDALMQDYAEKGMSLVDRIPNSGSADRALVGLTAAGGMGAVEPSSLTLLGALGLAYAPGVRKLTKGAMAPHGPKAKQISDEIRKRARIAGASGAVLGTAPDR